MSEYTGPTYKRTVQQNKALHKYFDLLAEELNNSGWTIQKFLSHAVEINWSKNSVKELLFKPLEKMLTGKTSTTELDKVLEIDLIVEHITRHVGELCGIHVPFPHNDPNELGAIIKDNNN